VSGAGADGLHLGAIRPAAGGVEASVEVAAASPWFDGHFPGRPVLPAIAHLALAHRLHRAGGGPGELARIEALRLSGPVGPGELLRAALAAADGAGRRAFTLAREADRTPVSRGVLVWSPAPTPVPAGEGAGQPVEPPPGPAPRLPHAGPSLLLEAAARAAPGTALGRGRIPPGHAAATEGRAASWAAVELAAQLTAVLAGDGGDGDEPGSAPEGYLVRLRNVLLAPAPVAAGEVLLARAVMETRSGPLATFRFTVSRRAGAAVAAGSLATFSLRPGPPP
jgi:predicted hotdog family 3-hydroxylacyl-ACP dehydratase